MWKDARAQISRMKPRAISGIFAVLLKNRSQTLSPSDQEATKETR